MPPISEKVEIMKAWAVFVKTTPGHLERDGLGV